MAQYYIKFGVSRNPNAGSKAMRDIMDLLDSEGWRCVPSLPVTAPKILKILDLPCLIFLLLFVLRKGRILYFLPSNHRRVALVNALKKAGGYRSICFINDLETLRMPKDEKYKAGERRSLREADVIIAPNENSVQILRRDFACTATIVSVGVWDYLMPANPARQCKGDGSIAFAGNLAKSPFVSRLGDLPLNFRVWGAKEPETVLPPNVEYGGTAMPVEMPEKVCGCSWGLVWDGDSLSGCSGMLGNYLKFNNPHKAGLYLASGLPLIVWSESGTALFVEQYGCGIVIDSLEQLPSRLEALSAEEYDRMKKGIVPIAEKIRHGGFFLETLEKLS